jgi:hypothetical protein
MDVEHIKDGLLEAIEDAGVTLATVAAYSTRNLNESGEVVVIKPAALLVYGGSPLAARNIYWTLYDDPSQWEVLIVAEDLAGGDAASASAIAIVDALKKKLGGLKLNAASGRGLVRLDGIAPRPEFFAAGVAVYSLLLTIESDFQSTPEA